MKMASIIYLHAGKFLPLMKRSLTEILFRRIAIMGFFYYLLFIVLNGLHNRIM